MNAPKPSPPKARKITEPVKDEPTTVEPVAHEAASIDDSISALLNALEIDGVEIIELQINPRRGRVRVIGSDRTVRARMFTPILPKEDG